MTPTKPTERYSAEIWSGKGKCNTLTSNTSCQQYIEKWAKTCKWCKNKGGAISSPTAGFPCEFDHQCIGHDPQNPDSHPCVILPDELIPDGLLPNLGLSQLGICAGHYELDCNICDSILWDYVPGGWEAAADENHRLHELAKASYIPYIQHLEPDAPNNCLQPGVGAVGGGITLWRDYLDGSPESSESALKKGEIKMEKKETKPPVHPTMKKVKEDIKKEEKREDFGLFWIPLGIAIAGAGAGGYFGACTNKDTGWCGDADETNASQTNVAFCDAGPFEAWNYTHLDGWVWEPNRFLEGKNAITGTIYGSGNWPNNTCGDVCCSSTCTRKYNWDGDESLDNTWDKIGSGTCNRIGNSLNSLPTCGVSKQYYNREYKFEPGTDRWRRNETPSPKGDSARIMCQRNPVVSGAGKTQEENTTLATNWVNGTFDLTPYGGPNNYEPFTEDEKAQNVLEAVRCCAGLPPQYSEALDEENVGYRKVSRKDCMPATACLTSTFCTELMTQLFEGKLPGNRQIKWEDFGTSYPENYNPLGGQGKSTKDQLDNLAYYGKMYCEMLGGGDGPSTNNNINESRPSLGCTYDKKVRTLCRKAMYNYAIEPVEVAKRSDIVPDSENDYLLDSYKLPLRIFDAETYKWCKEGNGGLKDSLPDPEGVCDMLLGRTCQQLQVDGWIDPSNFFKSKLLDVFINDDGTWVEKENGKVHTGVDGNTIQKTCSCFLLGSGCQSGDCSYFYCGSGTDSERGPDKVSFRDFGSKQQNTQLNTEVSLKTLNGGYGCTPRWNEGVDSNFTCLIDEAGVVRGNCFKGCNYVNSYDTCWNAGPDERKADVDSKLSHWRCNALDNGNSCETFTGPKGGDSNPGGNPEDTYGCFGFCSVGYQGFPNCGTRDWFDKKIKLNPGEVAKKDGQSDYGRYPFWQNYYAFESGTGSGGISSQVIDIPGWGARVAPTNSEPICSFAACRGTGGRPSDSIHPRGKDPTRDCGTVCNVNKSILVNNYGTIVSDGGVVMSNRGAGECGFSDKWTETSFASDSVEKRSVYMSYMGVNCQTEGATKPEDVQCNIDTADICIDATTGDNCMICGEPPDIGIDFDSSLVDKNQAKTCCTSDLLKPDNLGLNICRPVDIYNEDDDNLCRTISLESDCKNNTLCQWTTEWEYENYSVLQAVSNEVTYICQKSCPPGTIDRETVERNECGKLCSEITSPTECENACDVCSWIPEQSFEGVTISPYCVGKCPQTSGTITIVKDDTVAPTAAPIVPGAPTKSPTRSPVIGGGESCDWCLPNLNKVESGLSYGAIAVGAIAIVAFAAWMGWIYNERKKAGTLPKIKWPTIGKKKA